MIKKQMKMIIIKNIKYIIKNDKVRWYNAAQKRFNLNNKINQSII